MRLARLTVALIAAATLAACSSESITAPSRDATRPSFGGGDATCKAAYLTASGRCK